MATIFIVEDAREDLESLAVILAGAGHSCRCLTTGTGVLEAARREKPNLFLLDVMLPGASGFELCRRIRRDPQLYTVPIVMVSAMRHEEEVAHGLAQGADDYLVKPFEPQQVVQRVNAVLAAHSGDPHIDPLTQLPKADAIKREIQRRLSNGETFALLCAELRGIREFTRTYGVEMRDRAIRHLGRALRACGEQPEFSPFFVGHMGGGYFVCVVPATDAQRYGGTVRKVWSEHTSRQQNALGQNGIPGTFRGRLPDVVMCATVNEKQHLASVQQLFDTLAQLRHKALERPATAMVLDRRCFRP